MRKSRRELWAKVARILIAEPNPMRTLDVNRRLKFTTAKSRSQTSGVMSMLRRRGLIRKVEDGRLEDYLHEVVDRQALEHLANHAPELSLDAPPAVVTKIKLAQMPRSVAEGMVRFGLRGQLGVSAISQLADEVQRAYSMGFIDGSTP